VLALARQGLVLAGGAMAASAPGSVAPPPRAPAPPPAIVTSAPAPLIPASALDAEFQRRQSREGLTMLIVLSVGLVVGVALLLWLI
jgi:hypothetical protein